MIRIRRHPARRADSGDTPAGALSFEIRDRGEPGLQELVVLAGGLVFRWRVPSGLWSGENGVHHLIEELQPRSRLLLGPEEPWDTGSCSVGDDEPSVARFAARVQRGSLHLRLDGRRVSGDFALERLRAQPERWTGRRMADVSSPRA